MKIYTKQGDNGSSGLFDGQRVSKDHIRLETYGTVDELNSLLGIAIASCLPVHSTLKSHLQALQEQLLTLGADLATPISTQPTKVPRITAADVAGLENQIDAATAQLPALKRFILPGGGQTAAFLHLSRTVCRRAERLAVRLAASEDIGPQVVIYLNRLSDLLFTWARLANHLQSHPDIEWHPKSENPTS